MSNYFEPLSDYVSFFKDHHARNVSEHFEELVRESAVDEQENIKTIAELRALEEAKGKQSNSRGWLRFARVVCIIAAAVAGMTAISQGGLALLWLIVVVAALVLIFVTINPAVKSMSSKLEVLEKECLEKTHEAWAQMGPLNNLYRWDAARVLYQRTFPEVVLDEFFAKDRLVDLLETYGLSTKINDGRSILLSQSGAINENPFVVARYLQHWIGSKQYFGSLYITWTEQVRDPQGNWRTVYRSQTLTASVTKPFPEYRNGTAIIYGHEAAPSLSFSRTPSGLSGLEEGMFNNWRKNNAVKKVEKKARKDLNSGKGGLTLMSNHEFEALFNATNRDNETEFRVLFTPLGQQEMVHLLNDKHAGYGDDFSFSKDGNINIIEPHHLAETRFDADPRMFKFNELAQARAFFNNFHNDFFRSLYFGLAPLLAVPVYREKRSGSLTAPYNETHESSFWEHEVMANYIGEDSFKHSESDTRNLLKVTDNQNSKSTNTVSVTAYGYAGHPRFDQIPVLGGDGKVHLVTVPWVEYIGVNKTSTMLVGAVQAPSKDSGEEENTKLQSQWSEALSRHGASDQSAFVRGALAAVILG
ncbi:MAG: hypothetical protein RLZ28_1113 [Actinomycetota bacterium]|jgi:hypothetical protein